MLSREEFVAKYRHELSGMILDAYTANLHGAELSVHLRGLLRKVDAKLGEMYAAMVPPVKLEERKAS